MSTAGGFSPTNEMFPVIGGEGTDYWILGATKLGPDHYIQYRKFNAANAPIYPTAGIATINDAGSLSDASPTIPYDHYVGYLTSLGHPAFSWVYNNAQVLFPEDQTKIRVAGWAWAPPIGWASLDYLNTGNFGTPYKYGVYVNATNNWMGGEMWSPTVGWISFDACTDRDAGDLDDTFGSSGTVDSISGTYAIYDIAVDDQYMYLVGRTDAPRWRIEKRRLDTGELCTGGACGGVDFGTDGTITSSLPAIQAIDVAIDADYMYAVGSTAAPGDWQIEKRRLTTGALCSAAEGCAGGQFGTGGVVTSVDGRWAFGVAIDATAVYVVGDNVASNGGWRIEKRNIGTGALDTNFDGDGIVTSTATGEAADLQVDTAYLYVVGTNHIVNGPTRIEKRKLDDGSLCTPLNCGVEFGTGGVVTGDANSRKMSDIVINSDSLFSVGERSGTRWRIEKRDLLTGQLCNGVGGICGGVAFDSDGMVDGDASFTGAAWSIGIDSTFVYVVGSMDPVGGAIDSWWRIEKRYITDGSLDTRFGTGGVVQGVATTNVAYDISIDADRMYVVGNNDPTSPQWHLEKRLLYDTVCSDPPANWPAAPGWTDSTHIAEFHPESNRLEGWARILSLEEEAARLNSYDGGTRNWGWISLDGNWSNTTQTTLRENMAIGGNLAKVLSTVGFPVASTLRINGEVRAYGSKDSTDPPSFDVSPVALAHSTGDPVRLDVQSGTYSVGSQYVADKGNYQLFDFAWSPQVGWIEFRPFRFVGFPYLQADAGDIYGKSRISIPAPEVPGEYTATYLIHADGTIDPVINYGSRSTTGATSESAFGSTGDPRDPAFVQGDSGLGINFPGVESTYENILGKIDVVRLTTVVSDCRDLSNATVDCSVLQTNPETCPNETAGHLCDNDGTGKNANGTDVVVRHTAYLTLDAGGFTNFPPFTNSGQETITVGGNPYNHNRMYLDGRVYYYPNNPGYLQSDYVIKNGSTNGSGIIITKSIQFRGSQTGLERIIYESATPDSIKKLASLLWITTEDISINTTVTQMDGSYITGIGNTPGAGVFDTCALNIGSTDCSEKQLVIHGVVLARKFNFDRTYHGATPETITDPAELIVNDGRLLANPPPGVEDLSNALPRFQQVRP
jgi:hypothetical protein